MEGVELRRQAGRPGDEYYEGSFAAGLPNGVVRVETAGSPDRLRTFEAGRDVGRGDPGSLQPFSFASTGAGTTALNP